MPSPRSPDRRAQERVLAEKIYIEAKGKIKLVEIAEKLNVADSKVRKWKHIDKWDENLDAPKGTNEIKKKEVERSTQEVGSSALKKNASLKPRKRGAPKGNKNAAGGRGNPNPKPPPDMTKHGGYSKVYWDVIDEQERELINEVPVNEETLLIEQIQLFSVRERRIMQAINKYREAKEPVAISEIIRSEEKWVFNSKQEEEIYQSIADEKVANGKRMPWKRHTLQTSTENKDNIIIRLEAELSSVQSKKTRAIEALYRLRTENEKKSTESKDEVVQAWADKIRKLRGV